MADQLAGLATQLPSQPGCRQKPQPSAHLSRTFRRRRHTWGGRTCWRRSRLHTCCYRHRTCRCHSQRRRTCLHRQRRRRACSTQRGSSVGEDSSEGAVGVLQPAPSLENPQSRGNGLPASSGSSSSSSNQPIVHCAAVAPAVAGASQAAGSGALALPGARRCAAAAVCDCRKSTGGRRSRGHSLRARACR